VGHAAHDERQNGENPINEVGHAAHDERQNGEDPINEAGYAVNYYIINMQRIITKEK
jgi:hypothetical protein